MRGCAAEARLRLPPRAAVPFLAVPERLPLRDFHEGADLAVRELLEVRSEPFALAGFDSVWVLRCDPFLAAAPFQRELAALRLPAGRAERSAGRRGAEPAGLRSRAWLLPLRAK